MALAYDDALDALTDSDVWMDVGMTVAGYVAPWAANALTGDTLPPELFGLAGMAGSEMFIDSRAATIGSGAYTADKAAERFGLKASLNEVMA
jgi:hypothetical protein